jgi:hypothetical protein
MATTRAKKKATAGNARVKNSSSKFRAKVRMYRQGLGDCFLITLPRKTGKPFYIMIDCGVILGTQNPGDLMKKVVGDIIATTHGFVDLLLATHEHWDHLSGFIQARDVFSGLRAGEIWLAWTEDPDNALAKDLRGEHQAMRVALAAACARLRLGGTNDSIAEGLMEFFGAAGQGTTGDALKIVRTLCENEPRYWVPDKAKPAEFSGIEAKFYVLGPPHDKKMVKTYNPSKSHPETYGLAAVEKLTMSFTQAGTGMDGDPSAPFDPNDQVPLEITRQLPFFQTHYWGEDANSEEKDQNWRQIDGDWLDASSSMALQLDSATNNTSLVLAIELDGGDVLLFAADAQVGNWLSWGDLKWEVNGKTVTGPDLLQRTILYKTGHHGSHNATLREKGLEMMKNLRIAMIPVDHAMAVKKRWGKMPLDKLEDRLNEITKNCVLRIDKPVPAALADRVAEDPEKQLYYEVQL